MYNYLLRKMAVYCILSSCIFWAIFMLTQLSIGPEVDTANLWNWNTAELLPESLENLASQGVLPVSAIGYALYNTVILFVFVLVICLATAIPAGVLLAVNRRKSFNCKGNTYCCLALTVGILTIGGVAIKMLFALSNTATEFINNQLGTFFIVAMLLAIVPTAIVLHKTYSELATALEQKYIITAMGKGLTNIQIIWRHCLRNIATPVIKSIGSL